MILDTKKSPLKTIIVIDENRPIHQVIQISLRDFPYKIFSFSSLDELKTHSSLNNTDLMIIEASLLEERRLHLSSLFEALPKGLSLLITYSAFDKRPSSWKEELLSFFDQIDFLEKPFDTKTLQQLTDYLLNKEVSSKMKQERQEVQQEAFIDGWESLEDQNKEVETKSEDDFFKEPQEIPEIIEDSSKEIPSFLNDTPLDFGLNLDELEDIDKEYNILTEKMAEKLKDKPSETIPLIDSSSWEEAFKKECHLFFAEKAERIIKEMAKEIIPTVAQDLIAKELSKISQKVSSKYDLDNFR